MTPYLQALSDGQTKIAKAMERGKHPGWLTRQWHGVRRGLRRWYYGTALGDFFLRGRHPLQLLGSIDAPQAGNRARGTALQGGQIMVAGHHITTDTQFWSAVRAMPEADALMFNSFDFLADLASTPNPNKARARAEQMMISWIDAHEKWDRDIWDPALTGRRLVNWYSHVPLIMGTPDLVYRSRVLLSMIRQARHLARGYSDSGRGLDRFYLGTALILSGLMLPDNLALREKGVRLVDLALEDCVLPDGGCRSRALQDSVTVTALLLTLRRCYKNRDELFPASMQSALDRIGPFIRSLRYEGGSYAAFHGLYPEGQAALEDWLIEADSTGKALENAPHSGFQRLSAGSMTLIVDVGPPPPLDLSTRAHASTGAFELTAGLERLVVNMGSTVGATSDDMTALAPMLRTTAAHSTLVLDDRALCPIGDSGYLEAGVTNTDFERQSDRGEVQLMIRHNGYGRRCGVRHSRHFTLSQDGTLLVGEDILSPLRGKSWQTAPIAIRFHLHPDIQVDQLDSRSIDLKTARGSGWRFSADQGAVTIEDSLYIRRRSRWDTTKALCLAIPDPDASICRIRWSFAELYTKNGKIA